jgi:hypothetical protein
VTPDTEHWCGWCGRKSPNGAMHPECREAHERNLGLWAEPGSDDLDWEGEEDEGT